MQTINGILLVDKPTGLTSNAVLQRVKRFYQAKKAGHTGSLDPLATGMLPICFGEATKWCQYLLDADKCYDVTGCLGTKTDTSDATGTVIATAPYQSVTVAQLTQQLSAFTGQIHQIPSMYSALKHQGVPLYKFAREGVEIPREARKINIYDLQLTAFEAPYFQLSVVCSKGTYIRNLVEDIGEALGVGAHVTALHRRYTAGFECMTMVPLNELATASHDQLTSYLLPMEHAVMHFPMQMLSDDAVVSLRQGKTLFMPTVPAGYVRLYNEAEQFIGLGEKDATDILKVKRLLSWGNAD